MTCACRCSAASRCDQAAEDRAVDRADPVRLACPRLPASRAASSCRPFIAGSTHPGAGEHQLAERGGAGAAPVALEQRPAQRPLDALELRGEGRLGQARAGTPPS